MAKKKVNIKFLITLTAVVVGLALAAVIGGAVIYSRHTSAAFIQKAKEAEKQGDLPRAAAFLSIAANKDPNNKDLYMQAGDLFERCVAIDPAYLAKADGQYRRILELDPTYQPAVQRLLDETIARLHDGTSGPDFYTELKKMADQAVFTDPKNSRYQIYTRIASLLQWTYASASSQPDPATEKSIAELTKLADDNPDVADGAYYLSQVQLKIGRDLRSSGDTQRAHKLLDTILDRHKAAVAARPKNPEVQWRAALVFGQLHDIDDRADHHAPDLDLMKTAVAAALANLTPADPVYGDVMSLSAFRLRKIDKAPPEQVEKVYRDWVAARPHDPRARYELAEYLGSIPASRAQAIELLSKPLDNDPDARGYVLLRNRGFHRGTLLLLNDLRAQDAESFQGKKRDDLVTLIAADMPKITSMSSAEDPAYLKLRGKLEMLQGKIVDAVKTFERANVGYTANGGQIDLDLWSHLQRAYILTGQTGTAQKMMEDLLARAPGFTELRIKLAGLYLATNQIERAQNQLALLQANPPTDEALKKQLDQIRIAVAIRKNDTKTVDGLPEVTDEQKLAKASALSEAGRPADAVPLLNSLLQSKPGDERTVLSLVELLMQQKNRSQATDLLQQALKVKPDSRLFKDILDLVSANRPDAFLEYQKKIAEQIQDPMLRALRLAAIARQQADFPAAHKYLDQAEKIKPDDPRSLMARIQVLELERKFDQITPLIDRVASTNADGVGGLAIRTQVALERGDTPEALKWGRELVGRYPEFAGNWVLLGNAQQSAAQIRDALASFEQAIQRQPNNLEAIKGKIAGLEASGEYAEEKAALDQALALAPRDTSLRDLSLNWQLRHGDPELVVKQCRDILSQEPNNPNVYAALGQAAVVTAQSKYAADPSQALKLLNEAKDVLRQGLEKFGTTPDVVRMYPPMANALDALGNVNDAEQALLVYAAHPSMKDKLDAKRELARFYERHGRIKNAEEAWRAAYTDSHQSVDAQIDLAQFLLRQSKADEALQFLAQAHASDPRVQNQRIEALLATKRFDDALKQIQDVYGASPNSAAGLFYRGLVNFSRDQVSAALDDFSAARDKDPRNPVVQLWLSRAFLKAGRTPEATSLLEEILRKNPTRDDARILLLDAYAHASPPQWDNFDRIIGGALDTPASAVNPIWHQQKARSLADRRQFDAARQEIASAQKLAPGDMSLRDELVNILIKAKDWPAALAETDQQISQGFKQPQVYGKRAIAHAGAGDKAAALAEFDTAIAGYQASKNFEGIADIVRTMAQVLSPADASARVDRIADASTRALLQVELYGKQDDRVHQAQAAQTALDSSIPFTTGQRVQLLRTAADCYILLQKWDQARKPLEELVRVRPNDVGSLNDLAYLIATKQNRPLEAKAFSKRAYDLGQANGNNSAMDTHGWVLTQCGGSDLPQGINILQHLVDSNQNFTVARYHLAVAYLRQGGWQRALEELNTVQQQMKSLEQNHQPVPDELKVGVPKALQEARQKSGQASGENAR